MVAIVPFIIYHHIRASSQGPARENAAAEARIRCALEKRDREGASFPDLASEFGVPRSALNGRASGGKSRQKASVTKNTLEK